MILFGLRLPWLRGRPQLPPPAVTTPAARTYRIPPETRVLVPHAEPRSLRVPAENRSIQA